jgi:hypothetical protein
LTAEDPGLPTRSDQHLPPKSTSPTGQGGCRHQPRWLSLNRRLFDLKLAATSKTYCDEVTGICAGAGVAITELSTHLLGQLVAVNPAYDAQFDGFAPASVHGNPKARQAWAVEQMMLAATASANLGLPASVSFTGSLAFPYLYPWPQRPAGLIDEAFAELGRRWRPILDAFEEAGVDLAYEIHPGEDVFDGATFEMFLDAVGGHRRCTINYDPSHFLLQQLDYLILSIFTTIGLQPFTSKTQSLIRPGARASILAISLGSAARPCFAVWAMVRSIFLGYFRNLRSMDTIAGRLWSGNAA